VIRGIGRRPDTLCAPMLDTVESLILDLLEWIGPEPRPYDEVLDAWRTSCPRLPVWEEANERGLVECHLAEGSRFVAVTPVGWQQLQEHRPKVRVSRDWNS
jgi:hypothetical protein